MMGGTTVMMKKSALIVCSLCLGFSMTACEQRKEVKNQTATSSTVMERQQKESININHFSSMCILSKSGNIFQALINF